MRDVRQRVHLAVLTVLVPVSLVAIVLAHAQDVRTQWVEMAIELVAVALLAVAWTIGRRHHNAAAILSAWTVNVVVWIEWGLHPEPFILTFLVLPAGMALLHLNRTQVALLAGTDVLVFAAVLVAGYLPWTPQVFALLLFIVLSLSMLGVAASVLERNRRELETMSLALQERDRRRVLLVNNIAHDMASPLTPIELKIATLRATKDERVVRAADMMARNIKQLRRLVLDIKDLARLEAGELRLDVHATDVGALAREAVAAFTEKAEEEGIRLLCDAADAATVADAARLTQVYYNLLTNGIKFSRSAVHVRVTGAPIRVEVQDDGRGLDPDEIDRLFQPFSQVHARSEVKERGTGLGLYICKGIIEAHGGTMGVTSAGRGHGSTFWFELPSASNPA